ncbi:MAG: ABC transporter ATP-binding protein [Magnetococcales bacterium]|nr:ABC transporter ATP-binding protein [Magnetococcales bacterium]
MALLLGKKLKRTYQVGTQLVTALATVSLEVNSGQFLVITGPSGAGKSTLLNLLSGLEQPSEGEVLFNGACLSTMNETKLANIRNAAFGFIFQIPHVLPHKTVLENVALPFQYGGLSNASQYMDQCLEHLEYVGLKKLGDRSPNTLSGGELQRLVFARALVRDPQIIFADEPTGSLDAANSKLILELLKEQAYKGRAVVMVTHEKEAMAYGSDILKLDKV